MRTHVLLLATLAGLSAGCATTQTAPVESAVGLATDAGGKVAEPGTCGPAQLAKLASRKYSVAEVLALLRADSRLNSVKQVSPHRIAFRVRTRPFLINVYDDGDLALYYGMRGLHASLETINEWNLKRRLSRAYIDRDGDISLESDLLSNGGLNEERINAFIEVFVGTSVPAYLKFVQERHGGERAPTPVPPPGGETLGGA